MSSGPSSLQIPALADMEVSIDASLIQVTIDDKGAAILKINRPEKRNALSQNTIDCLIQALRTVDQDDKVRVVILTGSRAEGPFSAVLFFGASQTVGKVVADGEIAGADLRELQHLTTVQAHKVQYLKNLSDAVTSMRKPTIASVAGFALGGGFELAMMCDILYAAEDAKFGLPELSVGTIPGAGGTQRLTRAVGKQKAMDMILTSSTVSGKQLEQFGLVARAFSLDSLYTSTIAAAHKIASQSAPVVQLAKEAILNSEETHLGAGLKLERSLYYSSFSLEDRTEGMKAFVEKRYPVFEDK